MRCKDSRTDKKQGKTVQHIAPIFHFTCIYVKTYVGLGHIQQFYAIINTLFPCSLHSSNILTS